MIQTSKEIRAFMLTVGMGGVMGAGMVPGCSAPQPTEVERISDPEAGVARRVQAVRDWRPRLDQPGAALLLARTLWSDRQPRAVRIAVVDALATHAPLTLWQTAQRGLTAVGDPAVVAAIAERATDDGKVSMVGALVRRWARRAGDPVFGPAPVQRAEARAVVQLTGHHPLDALRDVLHNDPLDANASAAWTLLAQGAWGFDADTWAAHATTDPPASEAGRALARWVPVLDQWPTHGEQVRGLTPWAQAPRPLATEPAKPAGLALRHLPLQAARGTAPSRSVPALIARLAESSHVPRRIDRTVASSPGFVPTKLTAADALALHATLDALAVPDIVAALFVQADADHRDPQTEHGGGLLLGAPGHTPWKAQAFAAERRVGDHAYVSPPGLLDALYRRGLAHYHFHAQRHHHADYAGPGPGDLAFAAHSGLLCLTLTFINRAVMNVDATLPDGSVIDLGCIRRANPDGLPTHLHPATR